MRHAMAFLNTETLDNGAQALEQQTKLARRPDDPDCGFGKRQACTIDGLMIPTGFGKRQTRTQTRTRILTNYYLALTTYYYLLLRTTAYYLLLTTTYYFILLLTTYYVAAKPRASISQRSALCALASRGNRREGMDRRIRAWRVLVSALQTVMMMHWRAWHGLRRYRNLKFIFPTLVSHMDAMEPIAHTSATAPH